MHIIIIIATRFIIAALLPNQFSSGRCSCGCCEHTVRLVFVLRLCRYARCRSVGKFTGCSSENLSASRVTGGSCAMIRSAIISARAFCLERNLPMAAIVQSRLLTIFRGVAGYLVAVRVGKCIRWWRRLVAGYP